MVFWQFLTMFGDVQFWVGAALVSLVFLFAIPKRGRKHISWFIFLVLPAVLMSYMISYGLKIFFEIPRPCVGLPFCPITYSFPSGHATVISAAMVTLSLHYKNKQLRIILLIFGVLVILSRLMMGVHNIEDVVVGSLIGVVIGVLVQRANKNYQRGIKEIVSELK